MLGLLIAAGLLAGCQVSDNPAGDAEAAPVGSETAESSELSFFEEKLVGGWSRYHSYDGSRQYAIFNADRTGCEWERTASGSIKNATSFAHWQLDESENPNGTYSISWGDEPGELSSLYAYAYAEDEVLFGASNLIASRDPDVAECPS
jgi:hypothetical protein